jgi:hypothetical protein
MLSVGLYEETGRNIPKRLASAMIIWYIGTRQKTYLKGGGDDTDNQSNNLSDDMGIPAGYAVHGCCWEDHLR